MTACLADVTACLADVTACLADVTACLADVTACLADVTACLADVTACLADVTACLADVTACLADVTACLADVTACLADVIKINKIKGLCAIDKNRREIENKKSRGEPRARPYTKKIKKRTKGLLRATKTGMCAHVRSVENSERLTRQLEFVRTTC